MRKQMFSGMKCSVLAIACMAIIALSVPRHVAAGANDDPTISPIPHLGLVDLARERDATNLALAGLTARRAAIERKIRDLTEQARLLIEDDAISQQLKIIADNRAHAVERDKLLAKAAAVSDEQVAEDEGAVAEAQVRVLERREAVAASVGGGVLPKLNQDLVEVEIDIAEKDGMLKYINLAIDQASHEIRATTAPAPSGN